MFEDYSFWMPICVGFVVGSLAGQVIIIVYNCIQLIRYKIQDRKKRKEKESCTKS